MGKAWDGAAIAEAAAKPRDYTGLMRLTGGADSANRKSRPRTQSGFQNAAGEAGAYDFSVRGNRAFQQWCETWGAECLRVLKPGGHMLVFGGTRTYHRLACGLEDAGFEIRDEILAWMFGSGFPKSHNLADDWDGWGTALKPAHEPIVVARKPLMGTVAANVLAHGTGALNIDGCRIAVDAGDPLTSAIYRGSNPGEAGKTMGDGWSGQGQDVPMWNGEGRWPANVVLVHAEDCVQVGTMTLRGDQRDTGNGTRPGGFADIGFADIGAPLGDGEPNAPVYGNEQTEVWECVEGCPVRTLDEQTGSLTSGEVFPHHRNHGKSDDTILGKFGGEIPIVGYGDSGGASRFFYCAKVSRAERNAGLDGFAEKMPHDNAGHVHADGRAWDVPGSHSTPRANHHPTVKPIALMRWLIRLVTPPDGVVLDPFLGSGSTGCAAALEGFRFIGVEREADYMKIAAARIAFWAEHGEDGLRICAERDGLVAKRAAVEAAGQLSFLDG